jgi:aconitase A
VILKTGNDVSTDEILPAGARVLPFRSNIEAISEFAFEAIDEKFAERARKHRDTGSCVIGGENYGQGSSREHAALAPRFLGIRVVIAKSFARIHWQNLVNFGILPLTFSDPAGYENVKQGDVLRFENIRNVIRQSHSFAVRNTMQNLAFSVEHRLSERQIEMILRGSLISVVRAKSQMK